MNRWFAVAFLWIGVASYGAELTAPKAGKTEIFPLKDIKPGMQATAWTVFQGTQPEPVPIEIIGIWKKSNGPNDVILAKMLGKAKETGVAAGMSGSPVYIGGKLVGAVALRISMFSPDAICGITPIESMLEINDLDASRPADAKTPDALPARKESASAVPMPNELARQEDVANAPAPGGPVQPLPQPIPGGAGGPGGPGPGG